MLTKTSIATSAVTTFTWDYRNRLTSVVAKNAQGQVLSSANYTYDVFDHRIGVTTTAASGGSTTLHTVYDGQNAWADFNGSNQVLDHYLMGRDLDQLLARLDASNNIGWYLTDQAGSVRDIATTSGSLIDHVKYSSFGNILAESNPSNGDRFKFAGREYDATTGLYYNRARFYDPATGKFIGQDPKKFAAGDANLYRYVGNDPIGFTDPTGNWSVDWSGGIVGGIAGAMGGASAGAIAAYEANCMTGWMGGNVGAAGAVFTGGLVGGAIIGGIYGFVQGCGSGPTWSTVAQSYQGGVVFGGLGVGLLSITNVTVLDRLGTVVSRGATRNIVGGVDDRLRITIPNGSIGGPTAGKRPPEWLKDAWLREEWFACSFCGFNNAKVISHINYAKGGGNATPQNLVPACVQCNSSMGQGMFPKNPPSGYPDGREWPPDFWPEWMRQQWEKWKNQGRGM
jgi:RHS repeat-associated protein